MFKVVFCAVEQRGDIHNHTGNQCFYSAKSEKKLMDYTNNKNYKAFVNNFVQKALYKMCFMQSWLNI